MDVVNEICNFINLKLILVCAVEVVGIIQILKNFLPETVPAWIYAIATVVISIAVTLVAVYLPFVVTTIILVVCTSQLGYETILQTIKKLVDRLVDK